MRDQQHSPFATWLTNSIGPAVFALFVYAGQLKASPLFSWFPVDLTLAAAAITALALTVSRASYGSTSIRLFVPMGMALIFTMGLPAADLTGYSATKAVTFFTFTLLILVSPFYLLRSGKQRQVFLYALAIIGLIVAAGAVVAPQSGPESTYAIFEGSNTIGTARVTGTGALVCLVLAIAAPLRVLTRMLLAVAAVGMMALMLSSGSRGPFLAIIAGLIAVLIFSPGFARFRIQAIFIIAITAGAGLVWALRGRGDGVSRVFGFLNGEVNTSTIMREQLWRDSLSSILRTPFGIGFGGFSKLPGQSIYAGPDGRLYPHNILLETFVEIGVIAGFVFVAFMIISTIRHAVVSRDPTLVALFALLVFSLVNAMVSGDLNDNRLLWLALSVAWVPGIGKSGTRQSGLSEIQSNHRSAA